MITKLKHQLQINVFAGTKKPKCNLTTIRDGNEIFFFNRQGQKKSINTKESHLDPKSIREYTKGN